MEVKILKLKVHEIVTEVAESMDIEIVELRMLGGDGGRYTVQVLADRPGGITIDECAKLSRELSPHLEVADIIPAAYVLEVSSPGLRRPLTKPSDFDRFKDQKVGITLRGLLDGRKRFRGVNLGLDEDGKIVLEVEDSGGQLHLAWDDIEKANLDPEIKIK